ncbi:hypothetical protein Cgig2_018577 [Carnegiea gigantea]|uniref:DUF4283 domain-containing protein n=1 Tax=Carnegiea gigantea TaxID=171969 RepID=A0A9Q1QL61_9CARY|nr:hypothetical protein Cgig2_018577 [Carnegiea gigantea]
MVREIGPTIHQHFTNHSKQKVTHESNDGPLGSKTSKKTIVEDYYCSRKIDASPRRTVEAEPSQESPEKELGSNLNCEDQQTQHNGSAFSDARTRTANVNHNGYSEEGERKRDGRSTHSRGRHHKQVWKRKEQQVGSKIRDGYTRQTHELTLSKKEIKGEVNVEFEDWLRRSLVCTSEEPRDLATLSSTIINGYGQCIRICALSSYKYILTYPSETLMEEALNNHEELDYWFHDIQRWTRYDSCEERKVWLEVFGVPPRGWCWENFERISALWGRLISLEKSITHTDTFKSMKTLVIMDHFSWIEEEILLTIDDEGHRVMVREIGPTIHQYFASQSKQKVAYESNDGPPDSKTSKKTLRRITVAPGKLMPLADEQWRLKQTKSHRERN